MREIVKEAADDPSDVIVDFIQQVDNRSSHVEQRLDEQDIKFGRLLSVIYGYQQKPAYR